MLIPKIDSLLGFFAKSPFSVVAIRKLPKINNFFIYQVKPIKNELGVFVYKCTGAEFREAKSGKKHGIISIKIEGTQRIVHVTREELLAWSNEHIKNTDGTITYTHIKR